LPQTTILAVSYFFHLVATVIWIGGLVLMVILVWPEVTRTLADKRATYRFVTNLRRRFTPLVNLSLVVLVVTGLFQMTGDSHYDGVLKFSNAWSRVMLMKHLTIAGMVVSGLLVQFGVTPALERASLLAERGKDDPETWQRLRRREVRLTWINVILGLLVLGFTAWATAL
jgi:uncharacterized membrane protein